MGLIFFTNDKYKILKLLYNNQISIKEDQYINLSQQEIADIAHYSKFKTNKIINELIKANYIELFQNRRGKYVLTEKALKVVEIIEKNNL